MADVYTGQTDTKDPRVKLTARVSSQAYDAIIEIQRRYRRDSDRALPLWKIVDAAIMEYAKQKGITNRF